MPYERLKGFQSADAMLVEYALVAGSASIFLGLLGVLHDCLNGTHGHLFFPAGTEVAVEIAINILTLTLGPIITWHVWTRRQALP